MTIDKRSEDSTNLGLRIGATQATPDQPEFVDVLNARMSRRDVLRAGAAVSAVAVGGAGSLFSPPSAASSGSTLTFREAARVYDETHHVAPGYRTSILLR